LRLCAFAGEKSPPDSDNRKSSDWQGKGKLTSFPYLTLDPNFPTVHFDELPRQREPQPGALRLPGVAARLLEFLKYPLLIL
jgi:hypothetical protein